MIIMSGSFLALMAVAALGVVFIAALWLGLVVIASVLIAVCLVTVTLYLFVRLWPTPPPRHPSRTRCPPDRRTRNRPGPGCSGSTEISNPLDIA